jgi:hypothetical protein
MIKLWIQKSKRNKVRKITTPRAFAVFLGGIMFVFDLIKKA